MGSDEEEDEDDEEEAEKGGGTECDEGTGGEEDQMVVGSECRPVTAQDGSFKPPEEEQENQEGGEVISGAAEDEVILCETGKTENDDQTQCDKEKADKAVRDPLGQSEEDRKELTKAGNEISEIISVNTNQNSHTETEGDIQGHSNKEESAENNSQKLTETETDDPKTVINVNVRNNKVVAVEEEQNCPAEPMEVEATETSTTDASEAVRGEQDTGLISKLLTSAWLSSDCKENVNRKAA